MSTVYLVYHQHYEDARVIAVVATHGEAVAAITTVVSLCRYGAENEFLIEKWALGVGRIHEWTYDYHGVLESEHAITSKED